MISLDLESLIVPVATVKNHPNVSSTHALEKHLQCSYCLMVIERGNPEPIHFDNYTGPDCMERFLSKIEKLAKFFYHQMRKYPISLEHHLRKHFIKVVGFAMFPLKLMMKKFWIIATFGEFLRVMLTVSVTWCLEHLFIRQLLPLK